MHNSFTEIIDACQICCKGWQLKQEELHKNHELTYIKYFYCQHSKPKGKTNYDGNVLNSWPRLLKYGPNIKDDHAMRNLW